MVVYITRIINYGHEKVTVTNTQDGKTIIVGYHENLDTDGMSYIPFKGDGEIKIDVSQKTYHVTYHDNKIFSGDTHMIVQNGGCYIMLQVTNFGIGFIHDNSYLRHNNISDEEAEGIAQTLKINNTLTSISLYDNEISVEGAKAIAETLKINNGLTSIDLAYNQISDEGVPTKLCSLRR